MAWSSFLSWPLTPSSKFSTHNFLHYKEIFQQIIFTGKWYCYNIRCRYGRLRFTIPQTSLYYREKCGFYHPAGMPADKEYGNGSGALKQGSYTVCNIHFQYRPNKTCNWGRRPTTRQTNVTTQTNTAVAQTVAISTANRAMPYSIWNGRCNRLTK